MAAVPDEAVLAHELVGKSEHLHPVFKVFRDQTRFGRKTLKQGELLNPRRTRRLVVPRRNGRRCLSRPADQCGVRAQNFLTGLHVIEILDVQNGLGRLAPWPGQTRSEDDPQSGHRDRLFYVNIVSHGRLLTNWERSGIQGRARSFF